MREIHGSSGVLGQRHVTPGLANDPVRKKDVRRGRGFQGRRGAAPPPPEGYQTFGGEGYVGL